MGSLWIARDDGYWHSGTTKGSAWSSGGGEGVADWSDTNQPWVVPSGESLTDNMPSGVDIAQYEDYSNGGANDFATTMKAIKAAASGPYVVQMNAGTYHITSFLTTWTHAGAGYFDQGSNKYWCGNLGAGADKTFIEVDANILTTAQQNDISTAALSPTQYFSLFMSQPLAGALFSGITFRGNLQQEISLSGLSGTAPAPYTGLHLDTITNGVRVQFCRFQGFGFDAKASPPYELGQIESLHSNDTIYRCEIDGRLAPEIDSSRPVAAGGIMWNYMNSAAFNSSWIHHTRRSGWAMHDHFTGEGGNTNDTGIYSGQLSKIEHIADTSDSWAGDGLGFPPSNVEALGQKFTYDRVNFTSSSPYGPQHIMLQSTGGESLPKDGIYVTDPIIGDTAYNGCLIVGGVKTLGGGTNPWYTAYQAGTMPITVTNNGVTLNPVDIGSYNAAQHTPANTYLVRFI